MPARAVWKGTLTLADLTTPVSLHAAALTAERVTCHILNAKTGGKAPMSSASTVRNSSPSSPGAG